MELSFKGEIWYWRGPAPYHFVTVPDLQCVEVRAVSKIVSYGWGMIPASVTIGGTTWTTSLFPKNGGYIVPIKDFVRKDEQIDDGDTVTVALSIDA
ncbi:DUF1905 domain-containing protein [uncultured Arthrobacter sp.]|uniref:DUF1905 domain-containing protein n=1 Tax=uncultured Arthrobacter sp. TaxID=114050 RepID=UPI00260FBF64|nr:DUF1905 domain-containing protein [uncultured Arthrobacter sp.]